MRLPHLHRRAACWYLPTKMERWEWLIEPQIGIFQDDALGCFNEDAIALVHFATLHSHDRVLDLGTGNGVLCLYAQALYGGDYVGIDQDAAQIALAVRSAAQNGQVIDFRVLSAADAPAALGHGNFTRVLMNPPYFTDGDCGAHAKARHAAPDLLATWCNFAFLLLKNGGTLTMCYPSDRLAESFRALDAARFAPKRMRLLHRNGVARLALIEAKKLGGDGLVIEL